MPTEIFLATDIVVLLLEICCAIGNGLIIYIFLRYKVLRANKNLRLVAYLSVSDLLIAATENPYTWYLIVNWNSAQLNYNPLWIIVLSVPLLIQLKISLVLTIMIAADRNIALFFPATYRKIEHITFANISVILALLIASCDVVLVFTMVPLVYTPGCGSIGCFVNDFFRTYWGVSNMILGMFVISTTFAIFIGIRNANKSKKSSREEKRFANANRTIAGILLSSLICVTIPSAIVGCGELVGVSIFKLIGPFYLLASLLSGICNSIIFISLNDDARAIVLNKQHHKTSTVVVTTIRRSSVFVH